SIDRELEGSDAAPAETELLPSALVHGPVTEEPRVGREQRRVSLEDLAEMSRARLFLSLEEYLEVDGSLHAGRLHRVDRGEHRHDRALVVPRRTGVEARLRPHATFPGWDLDLASAGRERVVAEHRRPWRCRPLAWVHRLPIVVCIKHQRSRGTACRQLSIDCWRRTRSDEQL